MSKIGKRPVSIPKEVKIEAKGTSLHIEGPKGKFDYSVPYGISVKKEEQALLVERKADTKQMRAFHGLVRSLIFNMIEGATKGFKKELEIVGIGYKAQIKGNNLVVSSLIRSTIRDSGSGNTGDSNWPKTP